MVQDKNFQANKKHMDETKDLDRKGQARTTDRSADTARTGSTKEQAGLSKDKADISKRDVHSRK